MEELTKKERAVLIEALMFYRDDCTHYDESDNYYYGNECGLSKKDPKYRHITSILFKTK